eukprot:12547065-Alexandrium_andersonii.AAC.1
MSSSDIRCSTSRRHLGSPASPAYRRRRVPAQGYLVPAQGTGALSPSTPRPATVPPAVAPPLRQHSQICRRRQERSALLRVLRWCPSTCAAGGFSCE